MTVLEIIGKLLVGPLKLLFEFIFVIANRFVSNPGVAIIVLSLVMNFLVLPLYRRADAMQEEARNIDMKLHDGVAQIKKVFTGDERMMILQTYYRQNNYKPTDALKGSISLLLEIPFFIAAYQFLAHLDLLTGVAFGPIENLSAPDGLLKIGGTAVNLLPIFMTLINIVSCALYLKGFPMKTKVQLYGMAAFFLIFLYGSPAGLVFYWTLNNLFSLVKTIFYKLKNPGKVLRILASAAGLALIVFTVVFYRDAAAKRIVFLIGVGLLLQLPLLLPMVRAKLPALPSGKEPASSKKIFLLGCIYFTILLGLLIPSAFIADSPQEFIDLTYYQSPIWYLVSSVCLAAGTFLVWMQVFYGLASARGKAVFDKVIWILCGVALIDYMFYGTNLGLLSSALQYENGISYSLREQISNLAVLAVVASVFYLILAKWKRLIPLILAAALLALGVMAGMNVSAIIASSNNDSLLDAVQAPSFQLSKTGKNVVVIMLDRAMGEYIPFLMEEKPELKEQFEGFTYYDNVISFGGFTNFGAPALLGGYEYTPIEMNRRDGESLQEKHNEALKVMPVMFSEAGYDVTVCDPIYTNYQWNPDLSFYDEYPDIHTCTAKGYFSDVDLKAETVENNKRNFFCLSLTKVAPLFLQPTIYNNGTYNHAAKSSVQTVSSISEAEGRYAPFLNTYSSLVHMNDMTEITADNTNTFLFMVNDTTHEPILLQEPNYTPEEYVDNREYDAEHQDRFSVGGMTLHTDTPTQMSHYQSNMAALLQLGKWFDYLREQGVYDNTRIILVSDHGAALTQLKELCMGGDYNTAKDTGWFFPLLMVKDFDSRKFAVSSEFMTNGDVPVLATDGLIENPTNPFTGNAITSAEKTAHPQYIIVSAEWNVNENHGNTFLPAWWARVEDNIWEKENWEFYDESSVLKEYAFPEKAGGK